MGHKGPILWVRTDEVHKKTSRRRFKTVSMGHLFQDIVKPLQIT